MQYALNEILWLFLIYSFLGWIAETALAAAKKGRLLNRGFLNAPFSPIYGFGWLLFAFFLPELKSAPFFLFLGGVILATVLELFTGKILERITGRKWWDYSQFRFQFDGHICLPYSLLWGVCALICLYFSDRLFLDLIALIPRFISTAILLVIYISLALDLLVSSTAAVEFHSRMKLASKTSMRLRILTDHLDNALTRAVQKRIKSAYPSLGKESQAETSAPALPTHFAQGLCFYKVVCLFFIAAFLGDITEMIFCRMTAGYWMSRSSVVFGQFSIVWGLGAVLLTLILYPYRNRRDGVIFALGTVLGGAYEFFCSVFTELVFGTVFWDYSNLPFNLGGRINLLYCFFWGIAAVIWLKIIYPKISSLIERIPKKLGPILTWIMLLFMVVNIALSALVLTRYQQRQTMDIIPETALGSFLDEAFPDQRVEQIYPNLMLVDEP